VSLTSATYDAGRWILRGRREEDPFALRARFVVDASGPAGFLARELSISSALSRTETRSSLLFAHFDDVRPMSEIAPGLPPGPYPDDWAAVHHLIDEGWMYSLRFDHGTTSAGFLLTPRGLGSLGATGTEPAQLRFADVALTRVAAPGSLVVNSSRGGGAKDTWIVTGPEEEQADVRTGR
jgi:FADH2 O2-dependent halogenase